ncbi:hypothetical protein ACFLV7_16760, partial [Chloroflexota bacterium]
WLTALEGILCLVLLLIIPFILEIRLVSLLGNTQVRSLVAELRLEVHILAMPIYLLVILYTH